MTRAWLIAAALAAAALPARALVGLQGDTDHDGRLTFEEFKAGRTHLLMRADRDGDGRISAAEWISGETAIRRQLEAAGYPDRDIDLGTGGFGRMDADKDRFITPQEIDAYILKRFQSLDADHDGVLTRKEFEAGLKAGGRY